jgi:hypothetical protein
MSSNVIARFELLGEPLPCGRYLADELRRSLA